MINQILQMEEIGTRLAMPFCLQELALEGEARALVLALLVDVHHVFESSPLHVSHPLRRLACLLQRLASLHHAPLHVPHAVRPQDLQVQPLIVGVE